MGEKRAYKSRKPGGGRKKLKPEYDAGKNLKEQMESAVALYNSEMSLQVIGAELGLNPIKVRKLLITAGVYESDVAEKVQNTFEEYRETQKYKEAIPFPTENDNSEFAIAMREHPYDERCQYIKISKNIYLCSFLESNMTFRGVTGNNMLILMNAARLHDVGRSFGLNKNGGPENYCFAAVGKWGEPDGITEESPSKYRV